MTPELVRLSVGIEDMRDIIDDLAQAIEAANGTTHTRPNRQAGEQENSDGNDHIDEPFT